ncbi:MAG: NAD-dependent epimerase/dehydratase family protein [Gemmatimonadetes bacterium]|nr:NAD-dependent epimerase/dehydratase family protein [Gemmatimonadota bacterium]
MRDLRGKSVTVIGGAGFIGSHVVDELLTRDVKQVIVYDNFCRGSVDNLRDALRDPRVRIFEAGGDILQSDILQAAVGESQCVVHLAALWLLQCHEYPQAAFDTNIRGTFNVLEACRHARIERLVYSSSASVYGDAVELPMTESHPFNNRTFYGATKIAGEAMARAYFDRYGLSYAGLRYMNVYGARQDYKGAYIAVIMKILDRLDRGLPPVLHGDGSAAYDFIYVGDCARANVLALEAEASDQFYNVGSGTRTSLRELTEMILELRGSTQAIQYEPQSRVFVTNRVGCPEKAARDLGFRTTTTLRDGLARLIAWRDAHLGRVHAQAAGRPLALAAA